MVYKKKLANKLHTAYVKMNSHFSCFDTNEKLLFNAFSKVDSWTWVEKSI